MGFARTVVIGVMLIATAGTASAQTIAATFDDLRSQSHRGERVTLTDRTGHTAQGKVLRISAASIALLVKDRHSRNSRGQLREFDTSEVKWITERRGHAGRGALAGLIAGWTGAFLLITLDNSCHSAGCGSDDAA